MAQHCCDVKACDLRHTILIQAENPTTDAGGGQTDPWASPTLVAAVRACIEPLRGFEKLRAMQLEDSISHKITIRFRSGLTAKMRIVFGTRLFNIRAIIDPEERNRWLEIFADEGVAV
jgi:SPP1 family predicted phage head-tail adaptor